jgi:hypothetical protein
MATKKRKPSKVADAPAAPVNADALQALRDLSEWLAGKGQVVGLGVAVAFADSSVGTRYVGDDNTRLLGAIRVLEGRVGKTFE